MTTIDPDCSSPLDDALIDRIVDGDLPLTELGAALDRLERDPDGWKRCALAFLEAQCWRESFRALDRQGTIPVGSVLLANRANPAQRRASFAGWTRGVLAAGIAAVSFAAGWLAHPARLPFGAPNDIPQTAPAIATQEQGASKAQTEKPELVKTSAPDGLGEFAPPPEPRSQPDPSTSIVTVGRLRIGSASDGADVPILAGPTITEEWLRNQPPALDAYQRAVLERQGYQVDEQRRIITAMLPDGRRVSVPIDQVQVRYTGNNPL